MGSIDAIRYRMFKVVNQKEALRVQAQNRNKKSGQHVAVDADTTGTTPELLPFTSLETKFIETFHAGGTLSNQLNIVRYIVAETSCSSASIMRITDGGKSIRLYCRGVVPCETRETYKMNEFPCISEVVSAKTPVVHNDEMAHQPAFLSQWKVLFGNLVDSVIAIPIFRANGEPIAIAALSFKGKSPLSLVGQKIPYLKESLEILVTYAFINQGTVDSNDEAAFYHRVMDSIEKIEKVIGLHSADIALPKIGSEVASLCDCRNFTVLTVDEGDNLLRKYYSNNRGDGKNNCPSKKVHTLMELQITNLDVAPQAWVAINRKGMRINNVMDFKEFGIQFKYIHSVGFCIVRSMLIVPVIDHSGENALVIELADKDKGFSVKELEMALLFCQHVGCPLTCTVLLDRREKNFRRQN